MKLLHFALALAMAPLAQTSAQTSAPSNDDASLPTLRANARIAVVDVVVTDRNHHAVHGLKREDFTVLENKQPQHLRVFEEHAAASSEEAAKAPSLPKLPPGIFTNYTPAPPGSAVNILLLDALNTPLQDQAYLHQQLLKFVKSEKPGTSIAIFGLSTQLVMLQNFTTDPNILLQAIEHTRLRGSEMLDDPTGGGGVKNSQADTLEDTIAITQGGAPPSSGNGGQPAPDPVSNLRTFEAIQKAFQLNVRMEYTLDGINALARYLAGLPGRKNVIWFSGSFPLNILPQSDGGRDPFATAISNQKEYRETVNLLTRAQVAVYPVDARGLQLDTGISAASDGQRYANAGPARGNQDRQNFYENLQAEESTMIEMAADTGGRAFTGQNDLDRVTSQAINDGSSYYTLAYTPPASSKHDDFRHIEVKLAPKGYTLSYRKGYYADDPPLPTTPGTPGSTDPVKAASPGQMLVERAVRHGVPGATQIVYTLRILPTDAAGITHDALALDNVANQPGFLHIDPPYREYTIDYGADPRMIEFDKGVDGNYHGAVDFLTFVYQPDGSLVNRLLRSYHLSLSPERYAGLLRSSLTLTQLISVPAKGDYFIRTAVHDLTSDRIGSTEIPLALVKNLPPAPVPAQSPADNAAPGGTSGH